ncbi:MAG: DUF4157 domain-containing protein [Kofleriaceae bacterium]
MAHESQSHDDDVITSASRHSSALDAPDRPIESGIVMRKARDADGVAPGADAAVAAASSSSGSELPGTVMRKFESSLGSDLSNVRVHTGAESEAAADAVGARAYTVGQDIHFGAGQYDPSSEGGQHLLAHEVAHTVQQAGGPPKRQNKLEVSSPHDSSEHEADRAADAMVSGAPFAITGGSAGAARKLARERKWDYGVSAKPSIGDGFVKFQVDGNAKVEQGLSYVTVAGQLSIGLEAAVQKNTATAAGASAKESTGKDGKKGEQFETEIPLWKAEAKKQAEVEAEKAWTDYFAPVEANLVFGVEGSEKPGHEPANRTLAEQKGAKPGETKGSVAVGIKCKTKSGDSYTVKVQLAELAKKDGKVDVSGPAAKANYDKKFKLVSIPVTMGGEAATMSVVGNVKPELTFKPNYAAIAAEVAKRGAQALAEEALALAVESAALAGPPLLMAVMVAHGIYIAGEKATRDRAIFTGAKDAERAAAAYTDVMCGRAYVPGSGPRSDDAAVRAHAELVKIAARNKVTVEQLVAELQQRPRSDYRLVYGPAWQQCMLSYRSEVSKAIGMWRKEHWFAAAFTTAADDEIAVMKNVEIIWKLR